MALLKKYKKRTYRKRSYKKRYTPKRRIYKAVRRYRRERSVQEIHVKLRANPLFTGPTNPASKQFGGAYVFSLDQAVNYSPYLSIYDMFRINKVAVQFIPCGTEIDSSDFRYAGPTQYATASDKGMLYTAIDYVDSTVPSTKNDMYAYPKMRKCQAARRHTVVFRPSILAPAYKSAISTAYRPKWKQWITRFDASTPHNALKFFVEAPEANLGDANQVPRWRVEVSYYVSFKKPIAGLYTEPGHKLPADTEHYEEKDHLESEDSDDIQLVDQPVLKSDVEKKEQPLLKRTLTNVGLPQVTRQTSKLKL